MYCKWHINEINGACLVLSSCHSLYLWWDSTDGFITQKGILSCGTLGSWITGKFSDHFKMWLLNQKNPLDQSKSGKDVKTIRVGTKNLWLLTRRSIMSTQWRRWYSDSIGKEQQLWKVTFQHTWTPLSPTAVLAHHVWSRRPHPELQPEQSRAEASWLQLGVVVQPWNPSCARSPQVCACLGSAMRPHVKIKIKVSKTSASQPS